MKHVTQDWALRTVCLKPRQVGFTTLKILELLFFCANVENFQVGIVLHDERSAKDKMELIMDMVRDIGPDLKLEMDEKRCSNNRIMFNGTNSIIRAASGGANSPLRSFTTNFLLASEIAFWEKSDKALDAILPSIAETGIVCIESTPNGTGGVFYEKYIDAKNAKYIEPHTLRPCFYSWKDVPEFRATPPETWVPNADDIEYIMNYGITLDQAYWRRKRLESDNPSKKKLLEFARNYPINDNDCWDETVEGCPFIIEKLVKMRVRNPITIEDDVKIYRQPSPAHNYFIGVDTAEGGGGNDEQAFCVINENKEICATFAEDTKPRNLANILKKVGIKYNTAYILIENNIGYVVEEILTRELDYPRRKVYAERTTDTSRPILFTFLDNYIATQEEITDEKLKSQLQRFSSVKKEMKHIKDDLGFAFAWALWCREDKKTNKVEFVHINEYFGERRARV
jgi:hypothetical protein